MPLPSPEPNVDLTSKEVRNHPPVSTPHPWYFEAASLSREEREQLSWLLPHGDRLGDNDGLFAVPFQVLLVDEVSQASPQFLEANDPKESTQMQMRLRNKLRREEFCRWKEEEAQRMRRAEDERKRFLKENSTFLARHLGCAPAIGQHAIVAAARALISPLHDHSYRWLPDTDASASAWLPPIAHGTIQGFPGDQGFMECDHDPPPAVGLAPGGAAPELPQTRALAALAEDASQVCENDPAVAADALVRGWLAGAGAHSGGSRPAPGHTAARALDV